MLERSLKIFSAFGIEIRVHWTWVILALLIASSLASGWFPLAVDNASVVSYWLMGLVGAIGLFLSILLHELCHALVGRHYRMSIREITLFLFGGVAHLEDEPPSPRAEFWMALVGPLASLMLAAFFFGLGRTFSLDEPTLASALISYLASVNLAVAIFNLLPGFPLDGGRMLRAVLWRMKGELVWATKVASSIGQFFGVLLIVLGIAGFFARDVIMGVWFVFLGLLLMSFARQGYLRTLIHQTLHGRPAARFMNPHPPVVSPDLPLAELMSGHFANGEAAVYPVVTGAEHRLIGCVDVHQAKDIPESEWPDHQVRELTTPCGSDWRIEAETDAEDALRQMNQTGHTNLIVLREGRLVGMLSYERLLRYLRFRLS